MNKKLAQKSQGWTLVLMTSIAVGAFVPLGGCALILGIEEQESTFDPSDPYNGLTYSDLCKDYCDTVTENCGEADPQYLSLQNCVFTCMSLEPGDPNEAGGNNVECRLKNADRARGAGAAEFCRAAGPTSDPECGSNCETWCRLLEQECPTEFGALDDCEQACQTIPDRGDFDTTADYEDVDNIQCRILHLGSVARTQGPPQVSHCDHGNYIPTQRCLVPADTPPACEDYCRVVMGNCRGQDAVYESEEQCAAACAVLDPGEFSNDFEDNRNTVGCRTYHSKAAALGENGSGAETHCKHAGPTGGGFCGTYEDDAPTTGTCESYCRFLSEGCEEAFDAAFDNEDDCAASCKSDFAGAGADAMSLYSVRTAPDENNLQCRTYHAVLALTEAAKDAPDEGLIAGFCGAASAPKDSECEVPDVD